MEHTNIVSSPLVGISGGKLDKEVIKKVVENLSLTPANKRRLKKLEALHGAGFGLILVLDLRKALRTLLMSLVRSQM